MNTAAAPAGSFASVRRNFPGVRRLFYGIIGLVVFFAIWELGTLMLGFNPATRAFVNFGPVPTLEAFPVLWGEGKIQAAVAASGYRMGMGLLIAVAVGVTVGIVMGRSKQFRDMSNSAFQFLRMISPLAWMPLAVIVYPEWDQAIVFLIAIAAVWPVMFSTAAGLSKVDPNWFKVARNLGAKTAHMLTQVILPAIAFDVFTGIRLALGVAWIVLVPAEFFGVNSGLGYSIEDAREGLNYDALMAMVIVIGAIGYLLDSLLVQLIKHFSWHREA